MLKKITFQFIMFDFYFHFFIYFFIQEREMTIAHLKGELFQVRQKHFVSVVMSSIISISINL